MMGKVAANNLVMRVRGMDVRSGCAMPNGGTSDAIRAEHEPTASALHQPG